jgi:DNA-binding beta-propeller fold protein YncE
MTRRRALISILCGAAGVLAAGSSISVPALQAAAEKHYLYVATPGIRNYVEYGGIGLVVYDIDNGHRFVKRIPTFEVPAGSAPENVKGIAASGKTGRLYVSTLKRLASFDLKTGAMVWNREYEGGADRPSLSPDGRVLYLPSFEGPHWHAIDALSGDVLKKVVVNSGAHNTLYGPDGRRVYLAGLRSPILSIADTETHAVVGGVGPFSNFIRPFTINAKQTLCFVNVNELLGFEIGDIRTGKMLHQVKVEGFEKGPVKRHGCPSHGIGLTPDEKEIWLADGANSRVHVFDATVMPPRQTVSISLRDQPGWVTFSLDGRWAYPSTGEIIDTKTKKIVGTLQDENGQPVQSEKVVEVVFSGDSVTAAGDQFGIGRRQ